MRDSLRVVAAASAVVATLCTTACQIGVGPDPGPPAAASSSAPATGASASASSMPTAAMAPAPPSTDTAPPATSAAASVTSAPAPTAPSTVPPPPATATAAAPASDDTDPGVPRAAPADRQRAADAMQAALDYYRGLWETARKASQYPSDLARSRDPLYTDLLGKLTIDPVLASSDTVIPILMGKSMSDWNTWLDWQHQTNDVEASLGQWASGQGTEAAASASLAKAEADVAAIRG